MHIYREERITRGGVRDGWWREKERGINQTEEEEGTDIYIERERRQV